MVTQPLMILSLPCLLILLFPRVNLGIKSVAHVSSHAHASSRTLTHTIYSIMDIIYVHN